MKETRSNFSWAFLAVASGLRFIVLGALSAHLLGPYSGGRGFDLRLETLLPWLVILFTPALGIGPFAAAIANSRARSSILFFSTLFGFLVLGLFAMFPPSAWLRCFGLLMCETGLFLIARNTTFANEPRSLYWAVKLSHLLSIGGGILGAWFTWSEITGESTPQKWSFAPYAVLCYLLALVLCYLGRPQATGEPFLKESPVLSFVLGTRQSFSGKYYLRLFLTSILFWIMLGLLWVVVPRLEAYTFKEEFREFYGQRITMNIGLGMFVGVALLMFQQHEYRAGFGIPISFLFVGLAGLLRVLYGVSAGVYFLAGMGLGFGWVAFTLWNGIWGSRAYLGTSAALGTFNAGIGGLVVAGLTLWAVQEPDRVSDIFTMVWLWGGLPLGVILCVIWFRPLFEFLVSVFFWPLYRISTQGPGTKQLPLRGPYLIIANHAAWFDPLFVDKIVPAPTIPLMTSKFYDLPVISFLMRRVIGTIRVEDAPLKRETPEIPQAIEALDRGECVVIFPEGWLRRKESQPLKRFGRGIWQILQARPQTPIIPIWIEGNWGSFTSFYGGKPPTKGKKPDFWRKIQMGVGNSFTIPSELLADHMKTRTYLQNRVLEAREHLGLPPLNQAIEAHTESEEVQE